MTAARDVVAAKGTPEAADPKRFGQKAAGLARLPQEWVPPYFALAAGQHGRPGLRDAIGAALRSLAPTRDGVLVRSSAVEERLGRRGALDSARCAGKVDEVTRAMAAIAADLSSEGRAELAFVIQQWVPNAAAGHLSNERRVSQDKRSWLCEAELPVAAPDRSFRLRTDSSAVVSPGPECASIEDLPRTLRGVARRMGETGERAHLEWVWDGARVWLVQCDEDTTEPGEPPGAAWTRAPSSVITRRLRLFTRVPRSQSPFPKVNHVRMFRELGLPHGDVRVLAGAEIISELASGHIGKELRADLEILIAEPVVVRTDVKAETVRPEVLSPRTETCLSLGQLDQFLTGTAQSFLKKRKDPSELAFLAHRFVLGQAGAFSYGQPRESRVLVDATWGMPDSLLFHPHDSYRVDTETGAVERYLRCKTDYIDVDLRGEWRPRRAGRPWDWRATLTEAEAAAIGDMTARIADKAGEPVEVMFFITAAGEDRILPWFYRVNERVPSDLEAAPGFYIGEKVPVSSEDDLVAVDRRLGAEPEPRRLTLAVRPSVGLLRSRPFITAVANLAKRRNLPVELEGSQLSHAYYLLEDAGVGVRCVNPWTSPERRQTFGKLVRDLVPVRIERRGELARIYHADRHELLELVKAKVVEEALELYWEQGREAVIEEMADLLELLRTAAGVQSLNFHDIELAAERKREERGGFEAGVVLVETRRAPAGARIGSAPSLMPDPPARRRPATARRRVVRLPGRRLVVPLIPPTGWARDAPQSVGLDADEEVTLTYGKDALSIQVRSRATGPGADQLSLPGFGDT